MATLKLTEDAVKALPIPTDVDQAYYFDTELPGFALSVGRGGSKTFIARAWVPSEGKKKKITIGAFGRPSSDGKPWTVKLARLKARELIGQMTAGTVPESPRRNPETRAAMQGPTLRDAYEAHMEKLRKKQRSEATIATLKKGLPTYLKEWMDKPISQLTGEVLCDLHESIKKKALVRSNMNPDNPPGAALANRIIAQVSACWSTLNKRLGGKLGTWNPARSVERDALKPKRARLSDEVLPDWYARVQTMRSPIQRDGLVFALFTGLRSEDVRSVRFEHVDANAATLLLPDPKGGEARAFTIPLPAIALEIVARRRAENAKILVIAEAGGDHGFVFPGLNADGEVGPISDLRQQVHTTTIDEEDEDETKTTHTRFPAEDVHTLRRTYESVAHEAGISELDLHVLTNHSYASHNVNATYIKQHLQHLATCQAKIEAALWERIKPTPKPETARAPKTKKTRTESHLRALP